MTQSCSNCYDDTCPRMGNDERACEHHVRLDDMPVDMPDDPNPLDAIVFDLSEKVDALRSELDKLTSSVDDVFSAIVRARSGAER
jgi:hypothetical protein